MYEYKIEVVRDGRWWMVNIPEIDGVTQARRLAEAKTMAREYIALDQNIPFDDINIETASVRIQEPLFRELLEGAREIREVRSRARQLEEKANEMVREYCQWLTTYGVPVRDIAELLDISPQRVSQLAND
jgi:DNA-directed RNA polymerase specialized sigma subunit